MILEIENSGVRIFGTIHLLPKDTDCRRDRIEELIASADECVFEHDFTQPDVSSWYQTRTEHTWVEKSQRLRIQEVATKVGLDASCIDTLKAWAFMLTYPSKRIESEGYLHAAGIDAQAFRFSIERKKKISYLEDAQTIFDAFDLAPRSEHLAQINRFIQDPDYPVKNMKVIISAWIERDRSRFDEILDDLRAVAPISVELNVDKRNQSWMGHIIESIYQNNKSVYFVGSLHLFGEVGIIRLLQNIGIKCKLV